MTVGRQTMYLAKHVFMENVAKHGLASGFLSKTVSKDMPIQFKEEPGQHYGALKDLYATREFKDAYDEMFTDKSVSGWMGAYMKVLGLAKYSKTILSPVTHLRNGLGNVMFLIRNGHTDPVAVYKAFREMTNDTQAGRDYYRELLEQGIAGESVLAGEFKDVMKDAFDVKDMQPFLAQGVLTDRGIARGVRKVGAVAERFYHAEDLYAKIAAYEGEKARYRKANPNWTDQQVKDRAAEIVRNTFPTYSMVPKAVQAIRRFPLVGPFVSFPSEVVRTTYHTARLAYQEITSGNAELRKVGYKRVAGLFAFTAASVGMAAAFRAVAGVSADDESRMRRFLPEWSKNSELLHLPGGKYLDLGNTDPMSHLSRPIRAGLSGESLPDGLRRGFLEFAKPYISEEMSTRALLDVARNKTEDGREVYNPQAPSWDVLASVAAHVGKSVMPGAIDQSVRLGRALAADEQEAMKYDVARELLAVVSGQRVQPFDLKQQLGFRASRFDRATGDAERIFRDAVKAPGLPEAELQKAYAKAEESRRSLWEEFRADVEAAERLGMSRAEVAKRLKDSGLTSDVASSVLSGVYRPYKPEASRMRGVDPATASKRISSGTSTGGSTPSRN
jgi:hypothetical protein